MQNKALLAAAMSEWADQKRTGEPWQSPVT
jgi:hypothetical protein